LRLAARKKEENKVWLRKKLDKGFYLKKLILLKGNIELKMLEYSPIEVERIFIKFPCRLN
jgi:hypothetical protein